MSKSGAVIYVIGADACPDELLKCIVLFIGAACRGKTAYGISAVSGFYLCEPLCNVIKGFRP